MTVGQAYDIAPTEPGRIATTLGRHTNDYMVEYGWGGRSIDPKTWQPVEMTYGPSLWGHDRAWLPADQLAASRALRAKAAAKGQRQPVQVVEGNYEVGVGTC